MAKFANLSIVLLTIIVWAGVSSEIILNRGTRETDDNTDAVFKETFRRISSGQSDKNDDDLLVRLVKKEIMETARRIKNPTASLEIGARRAQNLVADLTSAYTTAISNSRSVDEAREIFRRFRDTVQQIVDFTKSGRFVT